MSEHIKVGSGDPAKRQIDGPWLEVNAQVGDVVVGWAGRSDLTTYMGTDGGAGRAAAVFFPGLLHIEINTDSAFGKHMKPKRIGDLRERAVQFRHAKASGAIMHEAGHARFTPAPESLEKIMKEVTPNEWEAFMLLEESRMEKRMAEHLPENRSFLRACALGIVFADIEEAAATMSGTRAAAHTAALSIARVDGGVLDSVDIRKLKTRIEEVLGEDLLKELRRIWQGFQACTNPDKREHELQTMKELAIEWNKLVQEAAEENGEGAERENGDGHEGDGKDGKAMTVDGDTMKKILKALEEAEQDAEIGAANEAQVQIEFEEGQAEAKAKEAERKEERESQKNFAEVFTNEVVPEDVDSASRMVKERQPSVEERRASHIVARELERAKYQDRIKIESNSALPPGRIKMRSVLQQNGMRQSNRFAQTEPFKQVKRKHAIDPDLSIGIMVDVSGSMGGAMEAMGVSAWLIAEAVRRIQGTSAMVYYGQGVFPALRPREVLNSIKVYSAADSWEECGKAARALDGALNLVNGSGARLVVIVGDGQYRPRPEAELDHMLGLFQKSGVGVLWIGYGYSDRAEEKARQFQNVEYIVPEADPADVAIQIGRAAAKALTNASQILNSR